MAIRPSKTGGNTTYTAEVAAGQTTIKASEVDGDFNQLYTNLDDSNIPAASIATNRLRSDAGISAAMLAPNAVTLPKMSPGASTRAASSGAFSLGFSVSNTSETAALATANITTSGGQVLILVNLASFATLTSSGTNANTSTYRMKLKRDGTTIYTLDGSILENVAASVQTIPLPTTMLFVESPTAAAHAYTFTWQWIANLAIAVFNTPAANAGQITVLEFA